MLSNRARDDNPYYRRALQSASCIVGAGLAPALAPCPRHLASTFAPYSALALSAIACKNAMMSGCATFAYAESSGWKSVPMKKGW